MAGTPNRNTRRPQSSGARRPASGTRRPQSSGTRRPVSSARRPASPRRRATRRRYTPIFMRPGFWLFICVIIILCILIFRGCGSEDMTDGQTVNTAESSNSGGATVMGNTEVTPTEKTEKPSQATKPSDDPIEEPSEPTEPDIKVTEPTDAPDEEKQDTGEHKTFIIEPGIHLIGSDVFAGTVNISAYSGTGSVYTTGGSLNIPNFGNEEGYTSSVEGIELKRGEYLTVSGNLNVKATYSVKYEKTVTAQLTATETVYTLSDMGGSAYSVMEEGGALKPGVYMIQAMEGNGFVYVPCRDAGGEVDFMIGVDGGYVDSINYVQLNEGDNVIIEGCTAMFIEMKEG